MIRYSGFKSKFRGWYIRAFFVCVFFFLRLYEPFECIFAYYLKAIRDLNRVFVFEDYISMSLVTLQTVSGPKWLRSPFNSHFSIYTTFATADGFMSLGAGVWEREGLIIFC